MRAIGFLLTVAVICAILPLSLLSTGSSQNPNQEYNFELMDDFTEDDLDEKWISGGFGTVGISAGSSLVVTKFIDKGATEDWHGPWAKTKVPASSNYTVEAVMKCFAEGMSIARADLRLIDPYGNQIYSFSWKDVSVSDSRSSLTFYGYDDGEILFSTPENFDHSIFTDSEVRITQAGGKITLRLDDEILYSGPSNEKVLGECRLDFLKFQKRCIPGSLGFDKITIRSVTADPPEPPTIKILSSTGSGPRINVTPPITDGGALIMSYNIFRGTNAYGIEYLTSIGIREDLVDRTAKKGIQYYYQATAVNGAGEGARSDIIQGVHLWKPDPPENIAALSGNDHVKLFWEPPENNGGETIQGYSIFRGENGEEYTKIQDNLTSLTFNDTSVRLNSTYHYRISASNSRGISDLSYSVMTLVGSGSKIPDAPRDLKASPLSGSILLKWTAPVEMGNLPITSYMIQKEKKSDGSIYDLSINILISEYLDEAVIYGETYTYRIKCVNTKGEGPFSEPITVLSNDPLAIFIPINFSIEERNGEVHIAWDQPEKNEIRNSILGYSIQRGVDPRNLVDIVETGITNNFTDTGLIFGEEYFYRILAFSNNSSSPSSNILSVNVSARGQAGIDDTEETNDLTLTSSIIYLASFIAGIGIFLFLLVISTRRPKEDPVEMGSPPSSEKPGNEIDNKSDNDRPDKET